MGCRTGKRPYPDLETAWRDVRALPRYGKRFAKKRFKRLTPYLCRACNRIHIGHRKR